ncbi:MAG TPA: hypothetical protein VKH44_04765 [Pirellulaceae bacterium]|nr:hypothetical protein [Pirellulaceae bacterium]
MDQNPLEQLIAGYFRRGQRVQDLRLNRPFDPTAIVVVLDNGKEYSHSVENDECRKLPEWLTHAKTYLQERHLGVASSS